MSWIELLDNPQAVSGLFSQSPSLEGCAIVELSLHRDGPRATLVFDIGDFPPAPPKRWLRDGANTVQLKLMLIDVTQVSISRWSNNSLADIALERTEDGQIRLTAQGEQVMLTIASGFVRLDRISAYHDTAASA